jgi:hypothetical protein
VPRRRNLGTAVSGWRRARLVDHALPATLLSMTRAGYTQARRPIKPQETSSAIFVPIFRAAGRVNDT